LIVLDSSAALDFLLGTDERAMWVESQLDAAGWSLHATYVIDVEVFAVVRARVQSRMIAPGRGRALLDAFAEFPLTRYPHIQLFDRMWALRTHVSSRDASFVALAEALNAPLLTTDLRLSRAHGIRTTIIAP